MTPRSRAGQAILSGLAATFLALAFVAPPAAADHAKDGGAGDADNADHHMDRNSLSANGDAAAVRGRDQLNRSQMNATFTGSGDVEIYDGNYGDTSWFGITECQSGYNWINGNCDVFKVRFNTAQMAGHSLNHWKSLGCHELGHTAGLGHRVAGNDSDDNSCMRTPIWPLSYDAHDIAAINDSV
jgi:hypothetical protein